MKTTMKKLYKSSENRVIAGVMGGIGEYFDVDPVLFRVGYLFLTIFSAFVPGIIAYLLMALVMPNKPKVIHEKAKIEMPE